MLFLAVICCAVPILGKRRVHEEIRHNKRRFVSESYGERLKIIKAGSSRGLPFEKPHLPRSMPFLRLLSSTLTTENCFTWAYLNINLILIASLNLLICEEDWDSIQSAAENDNEETIVHSFGGMCAFSNEVMGQETEGAGAAKALKHLEGFYQLCWG